ncbi:MAG: winged helix-turn-helix domain-containing protein, partial [Nanoarchaeota archaeon]
MTGSSSIMIDLDDPRSEKIAEVISNKTAKKILISLAEGEKSIGDISLELGLPVNTVSYNIDKM